MTTSNVSKLIAPPSTVAAVNGPAFISTGPFTGIKDLRPTQEDQLKDELVQTNFYFCCNESGQEKALAALAPATPSDKTVHVGFSMNFNYDLIAARLTRFAIVADIAPLMLQCYHDFTQCILLSSSRKEFVQNFQKFLNDHADYYYSLPLGSDISCLCDLHKELDRPGSWLFSDTGFNHVKKMHENGRILYLKLNMADNEGAFDSIRNWTTANGLIVDTVYLSNIPEWLHPSPQSPTSDALNYLDNIRKIIAPTTHVIDAFKADRQKTPHPVQRVIKGAVELPAYVIPKKPTISSIPPWLLNADRAVKIKSLTHLFDEKENSPSPTKKKNRQIESKLQKKLFSGN